MTRAQTARLTEGLKTLRMATIRVKSASLTSHVGSYFTLDARFSRGKEMV